MLWPVPSVQREPEIVLDFWQICKSSDGTYHFTGYETAYGSGRCSSQIKEFDAVKLEGKTRSGRVYKLTKDGRGWNRDAASVASSWARFNSVEFTVVNPEDVKL